MPASPPHWRTIDLNGDPRMMTGALDFAAEVKGYPHWDKVRRLPMPPGVTPDTAWAYIKLGRLQNRRELPLRQSNGRPFWYTLPDALLQGLEEINTDAAGHLASPGDVATPENRDRFIVRSLMEEAITSSQLEGASTTHKVAKELLRSQRGARTKDEQMILNNYRGMQWVRDHVGDEVTPEGVKHLHEILTVGTLDDPKDAGRLQQPSEERVIVGAAGRDLVLHEPPAADELPERLQALCDFANGASSGWMPRTLRAILCHFQMGYDHYFVDGNGRTARALFYWVALREGAWLLEFVPISRILKNAPAQYGEAYLKTETDEGDTTYFALHQARVLHRGLTELNEYLARKVADDARVKAALPALALNHRERALVEGLLKDPTLVVTARSHAMSHDVTLPTARGDLRRLTELHVLTNGPRRRRQESWVAGDMLDALRRQSR